MIADAAALHGCVESIRSAVSSLVDLMHVHPLSGLTEAVPSAFAATGMRGFVCRGFMATGAELGVPASLIEAPLAALGEARTLVTMHIAQTSFEPISS